MKILNYGAGAVGLGIDSCLLKAGAKVDIIARKNTVSSLKKNGLQRDGIFGTYSASAKDFSCYSSLKALPRSSYDFILVSTKSFDSAFAAHDLGKHPFLFNKKTKIVLCQNGWGNTEIFAESFPKNQIYNARVITGFTRPQPHHVTITVHADAVHMGSLFHSDVDILKPLCEAITTGDLPCQITTDIGKDLWAKMLYNCALNSLGALFDVPYGVLGEWKKTRELMKNIINEVYVVMQAAGYQTHWPTAKDYLKVFYEKLLPPTAQHRSSTLQDFKAKKKTEIDALNGSVIQIAQSLNIPAPVNTTVYQMVKFIEERNRK